MTRRWPAALVLPILLLPLLACGGAGASRAPDTTPAPQTVPADNAATSTSAGQSPATTDLARELGLAPEIRHGELDNGLRYFVLNNSRPENRAELRLVVNAGSMQEDEDQLGLAHFVEHMAFNGTKHFAKQELVDYLEGIGMGFGPDINAYTSFDETVYMLTVPTDDPEIVDQALLILEDWACGISFDGEEIDKERGVVLEERRAGRGAAARIRDVQLPVLFSGSRYADRLPIGTEEVLSEAPHDALRRFYRDWYRPDLMAVIAVGDLDVEAMEGQIRDQFAGIEGPEKERPRQLYPVPAHGETLVRTVSDPEATVTRASINYKFDRRPENTLGDYRRMIVELLYHQMLNARLDELRQRPDAPFLNAGSFSGAMVRSSDIFVESVSVEDGRLTTGLEALLLEVERVKHYGFSPGELQRMETDLLRSFEQQYRERDKQRSSRLAGEIIRYFLSDEPMPGITAEFEMLQQLLPTIELEEVNQLGGLVGQASRVVLASGPQKEDSPLPPDDELLAVLAVAADAELSPWVDQVRDEPLVPQPPAAGRIVERSEIPELGLAEWRLSNGVRVVLKPTDFKNDEVRLAGTSPGGHSLVADEVFASAAYGGGAVRLGGLGAFSYIELEKALSGKMASASVGIGELSESANGWASPDDLETMFELLYLSITRPRRDEDAFASWLGRARARIENRDANPEAVFRDRMTEVLAQEHFRRRPISFELLDEVDLDAALAVHAERFADVGDFTFVLVGNFEVGQIEPLVLTYLGGLPAKGRQETWRDIGVNAPATVERFEVHQGLEPKSRVRITFSGDAEWSREASYDVSSLAELLRIRLREVLREDKGGTYGVGVFGGLSREPRERSSFTVTFGCAPENVDELVAAVFDEIESVKRDGATEEYLVKIREGQVRDRETNMEENGFWIGRLLSYYRFGMDPRQILQYQELVDGLSSDRLRRAAARYLDTERYVQGTLYPQTGE